MKSVLLRLRFALLIQGSPVTVTVQETDSSPLVAVMVAVPPALPVTEPPSTAAMFSLELVQTTSPDPPLAVSRAVSPAAGGGNATITAAVDGQELTCIVRCGKS